MESVPERAIQVFEAVHGVRVTVHDLMGDLGPVLDPGRSIHTLPACVAIRAVHSERCIAFDVHKLRSDARQMSEGRFQMCYAGVVECVLPIYLGQHLAWVLFAGARRKGRGLRSITRDPERRSLSPRLLKGVERLSPIHQKDAEEMLESLRQLGARLRLWQAERMGFATSGLVFEPGLGSHADRATRRWAIMTYLHRFHQRPLALEDLARHLALSEGRTAHLVKEVCGRTFIALLLEIRLQTAQGILRHSGLSVQEVALRSGFGDVSHFHRCFQKQFKTSPLRYRKAWTAKVPLP